MSGDSETTIPLISLSGCYRFREDEMLTPESGGFRAGRMYFCGPGGALFLDPEGYCFRLRSASFFWLWKPTLAGPGGRLFQNTEGFFWGLHRMPKSEDLTTPGCVPSEWQPRCFFSLAFPEGKDRGEVFLSSYKRNGAGFCFAWALYAWAFERNGAGFYFAWAVYAWAFERKVLASPPPSHTRGVAPGGAQDDLHAQNLPTNAQELMKQGAM